MTGLIREREKSVGRERALSAAGGLLVAATEPAEIVIAALQAVIEFSNGDIDARVCRTIGGQVTCGRGRRDGGPVRTGRLGPRHDAAPGLDRRPRLRSIPAAARAELRLAAETTPSSMLELRPGGSSRPVLILIVAGKAAAENETRYSLRTLAQPGVAGAQQHRVRRRGSSPRQRGQVRHAGPELDRPDHRAGRRQHGHVSEPLDRARARLYGGGGHRPPVRRRCCIPTSRPAAAPCSTPARERAVAPR